MKKPIVTTLLSVAMLGGIAVSSTACKPSWRNKYAYDIDFNADVKGTEIEFWTGFGSAINDVLEPVIAEFEHMTGVKVKYESKGGYTQVLNATTLAATSGKFPHLIVGYPDHFATYVNQDIIVRLDYYFQNDVRSSFEPDNQQFKIEDFYADYMRENQSIEFDAEGKPYTLGVPFNKSTEVLIVNDTFFSWCAANEPSYNIHVPATYAELDTVGKSILQLLDDKGVYDHYLLKDGTVTTDQPENPKDIVLNLSGIFKWGTAGKAQKDCFKPFSYDSQANLFITSIRQNGGTYTELDKETRKGYVAFNSPETVDVLNKLNTMYNDQTFGIPADWNEQNYGSNPFKASKTVMTLGSSAGVANDAPTGNAFDIKAAPVPYWDAERKFVISQGANLALLDKGSREQRLAAWMLLKFLTKYANGYICSQTSYYPASPYAELGGMWKGADEEKYVDYATWLGDSLESPNTTERIKGQTANINVDYYIKATEKWTKFVDQPFPGSASVREEVASVPKYVFLDKMEPQKAIDEVLKQLRDYVR